MSINSYLCKHFDKDKNGNVTIGSVFFKEDIFLFMTLTLFFSWMRIFILYSTNKFNLTTTNIIYMILNTAIYLVIVLICIHILCNILKYISNISIAKCPLENKD